MEVNLYHILFIVLICITIVFALYPKQAIVKSLSKSTLSLKNKSVINFLEIAILSFIAFYLVDLNSLYKVIIASILIVYLQLRLMR